MPTNLAELLIWIVAGPGGGIIVSLLLNAEFAAKWSAEVKRYVALFGPLVLVGLAFGAQVALGYVSSPGAPVAWVEALVALILNIYVSQVRHARQSLATK